MKVWLRKEFSEHWQGKDPFVCVNELTGDVYRNVDGRRTFRFDMFGNSYFAKVHSGVGWKEIIKNLLHLKAPVLGAAAEWQAIQRLEALGVDTMTAAGFGSSGRNPARQDSFLITDDLAGSVSLEDFFKSPRAKQLTLRKKRALIGKLADMSARLHDNGVNHRDFYLCHFHLFEDSLQDNSEDIRLHLIDLHRTQLRRKTPYRWRLKDVAGLYFSAMDFGFSRNDRLFFWRRYCGESLKNCWAASSKFRADVERKANALYQREIRKRSDV